MTARNLAPVPEDIELPEGPFDVPVDANGFMIPRLRIVPAAGEPYEVQPLNPDMLKYEETANTHHWAGAAKAPFLMMTFLAWTTSVRTGIIDAAAVPWEVFKATTPSIRELSGAAVTPTRPGPVPG